VVKTPGVSEVDFWEGVEVQILNWFGAHPGLLMLLVAVTVAFVALAILLGVVIPIRRAYLEAANPEPALRSPAIAGQIAALRLLETYYEWVLGKLPFVHAVPERSISEVKSNVMGRVTGTGTGTGSGDAG